VIPGAGAVYRVLAAQRVRELCLGTPFVLLLAAQQAVLYFLQRNALASLDNNGLMVALHPAEYGLLAAVVLLAVFAVVYAALGPARERESGALETLFYGPVSPAAYVLAEMTAIAAAALAALALLVAALLIGRAAVSYDVPPSLLALLLALLCVLAIGAAAVCAALFFRQERAATIVTVALLLGSLAAFAGDLILSRGAWGGSFFLVFLRSLLSGFDAVFRFVFPLGLFLDDLVRYEGYGAIPATHLAWYALYGAAFIAAAVAALRRRGVSVR
jgi:ABC-type transport system involved in multi-copper enzyme maturation permease subunit